MPYSHKFQLWTLTKQIKLNLSSKDFQNRVNLYLKQGTQLFGKFAFFGLLVILILVKKLSIKLYDVLEL